MPLFIALDSEGKPVTAEEAESGMDHKCICCGALMRPRKCIARAPHFFLYGDKHKSRDCAELENERTAMRVPALLDAEKFARAVMKPRSHKGPVKGGGGGHKPSDHKEMLPPNCIRQLIACGVRAMDPSSPIEGGVLSDVYVGPKAYEKCIVANEGLGFRAVDLWLDSAVDGRIRYVAVWDYKDAHYRSFFEHTVSDDLIFEEIADELFQERRYYYGRTLWVKPRFKTVTVAGIWETIARSVCTTACNNCKNAKRVCRGLWSAPLERKGQIYYSDLDANRF